MKIYVAGHEQDRCRSIASDLRAVGHTITARWLDEPFNPTETHTETERRQIADRDEADVTAADAVVLADSPEKVSGGKFVEAGIALGQGKPVFVIGRRENMLMWHSRVQAFDSVAQFVASNQAGERQGKGGGE